VVVNSEVLGTSEIDERENDWFSSFGWCGSVVKGVDVNFEEDEDDVNEQIFSTILYILRI
jgi:hypothetical protein